MEAPAAESAYRRRRDIRRRSQRPDRNDAGEHGERAGPDPGQADPSADALVKAVGSEFERSEGRGLAQEGVKAAIAGAKTPAEIVSKALDALKSASAVLDAKGGPDAAPFKIWLAGVAKSVAEAGPEGGFLGFGGTQVSEAEKATVAQIAGALGVAAPAV
jgi:hypothetical protein